MNVFISYAGPEGLELGLEAKRALESAGHKAWLWQHSRSLGSPTWDEIARSIIDADRFLYICSRSSQGSYGQREEYNIALNWKREWSAFRVDGAPFPPALTGRNYAPVSSAQFASVCRTYAETLCDLEASVSKGDEVEEPATGATDRADYVRELRRRTENLDRDKVTECLDEILRSYESATVPRRLSRVSRVDSREKGGFRRIGLWLRSDMAKFNDRMHNWSVFPSRLGHHVALAEEKYLYECLTQRVDVADVSIPAAQPDFSVLEQEIHRLIAEGGNPNVLLAPIQLMVAFLTQLADRLSWDSDGRERLTLAPGAELRIYWSNGYAPLDRFIAFNSEGGLWSVKPDSETGHALTVALGQSKLYSDEVEWVAETVVKYEITKPEFFRAVPLEGEAKSPEQQASDDQIRRIFGQSED
jgi:hypothetical protein